MNKKKRKYKKQKSCIETKQNKKKETRQETKENVKESLNK